MPRKPRIEATDTLYHVINRGNYRSSIFESERARDAFRDALFEACGRFSWELSAYCLMRNHFHLCLSTPLGNLSVGMKWLQGTYATRYNRFRKESGHLFQGRFKSLIVEPGDHWLQVVDYIHLNPARAGLADIAVISKYPWSSLALFPRKKSRPDFFDASWMDYYDGLSDSRGGWMRYHHHLRMQYSEDPKDIEEIDRAMCRGWCIGSDEFKQSLLKETLGKPEAVRLDRDDLVKLNEARWEALLETFLRALKKDRADAPKEKLSADWKLAIATRLRETSSASNRWIAEKLHMGRPRSVSAICGKYKREAMKSCPHYAKIRDLTIDT